ncbi:MAG TPA: lysyl oxidase family protein [Bacteroidia bacterium]
MIKKLLILLCLVATMNINAQCPAGQALVVVSIVPDQFPSETTWNLKDLSGVVLAAGNSTGGSVCVDTSKCLLFTILDTYGDGICCNYGNGSYTVTYGGNVVASGGQFGRSETTSFHCPPGSTCSQAIVADTGNYTAPLHNWWYEFQPTVNGMYEITTCFPSNTCDTKLWVYSGCNGNINETNTGTEYYNNNNPGCGIKAVITAAMTANTTYYIRVGDSVNACGASPIDFAINYIGGIVGCMNSSACNYNPLATVSGQCYFSPDPHCVGPDLIVDQQRIANSLIIGNTTATNCEVVEGCLAGYGNRTILKFDTRIENIGQWDYYIGNPTSNPGQFSTVNCHGHTHYEGYADYILYNSQGDALPIGRKNGFCVMDLSCPAGIPTQYGCSNMGITAGCADIYSSGLSCQWIDITDVDTGFYTLAVKVNWDQSPDALGHHETNYINNWAQVCIHIGETAGVKNFYEVPNCPAYVDCAGTPFGNSVVDCNGNCGGGVKRGDLDNNSLQQTADAQMYVSQILNTTSTVSSCTDLNANGTITVFDAALVNQCARHGAGNNVLCSFPRGANNPTEVAIFGIENLDVQSQFFDITITNPNNQVLAYEFTISGAQILNVQNMIPVSDYPITPEFTVGGNKVIGISYIDSAINKKFVPTKLCRIYYSALTDSSICIANVIDVVNKDFESISTEIGDTCLQVPNSVSVKTYVNGNNFIITPNPASESITVKPYFRGASYLKYSIVDLTGREVIKGSLKPQFEDQQLDVTMLANGMYTINIESDYGTVGKKLIIKR